MVYRAFALTFLLPSLAVAQATPVPLPAGAAPEVASQALVLPNAELPAASAEPHLELYAAARYLEEHAEPGRAAGLYEAYARGCLTSAFPCASSRAALERAFSLRRSLGEIDRADQAARDHASYFAYSHPREALRVAFERVSMHLAAGDPGRAANALSTFDGLLPDPPLAQALVSDALRAQLATLQDRPRQAALHWRRVERRFERATAEMDPDGAVPVEWVLGSVADGRLARAERSIVRYLSVQVPRWQRIDDRQRWWSRTMGPWLVRSRRRLLLARMALERVYELGSPRHSVIAAARIGQLYGHQTELHDALRLPDDEWVQTLVSEGRDRPGFDDARVHFQTCVRWAEHHGVAPRWSARCAEALRALDPAESPSVLVGASASLPPSPAAEP